jgi:Zn-dependent peptidase ImmA (M78 family)
MTRRCSQRQEEEANYFARCLLMPESLMRAELEKRPHFDLANDKMLVELARLFQVPVAVMVIRLKELS